METSSAIFSLLGPTFERAQANKSCFPHALSIPSARHAVADHLMVNRGKLKNADAPSSRKDFAPDPLSILVGDLASTRSALHDLCTAEYGK